MTTRQTVMQRMLDHLAAEWSDAAECMAYAQIYEILHRCEMAERRNSQSGTYIKLNTNALRKAGEG